MAFEDILDIFGGPMGGNLFGPPSSGQLFENLPVPGVPQMGGTPGGIIDQNPVQVADAGYTVPATGQQLPPGTVAPPAAPLLPPTPRTVARDPDASSPLLTGRPPNAGGGPDERTAAPAPIVPPKIDVTKPTSSGTTIGGQAAPPPAGGAAAPAAAPVGAPGAAKPGDPGFLEKLNKAVAGMPALGGQQGKLTPANIGSAGQPHIPQGGAQLMQQLLEAQQKAMPVVGKVPSMGGVLGRRVQGLL